MPYVYKYFRSGGVPLAVFIFDPRGNGLHVWYDVVVTRMSSCFAISGCLLPNAFIAVSMASSRRSVLVAIPGGGNGNECSYGKSGVGCQATNVVPSLVVATFSTLLSDPTGVVNIFVDFGRICLQLYALWRCFDTFFTVFKRKAAIFRH